MTTPGREADLSYDTFIALARQHGLDDGDKKHLALLYEDVRLLMADVAATIAIDAGSDDPLNVYAPGSEVSQDGRAAH